MQSPRGNAVAVPASLCSGVMRVGASCRCGRRLRRRAGLVRAGAGVVRGAQDCGSAVRAGPGRRCPHRLATDGRHEFGGFQNCRPFSPDGRHKLLIAAICGESLPNRILPFTTNDRQASSLGGWLRPARRVAPGQQMPPIEGLAPRSGRVSTAGSADSPQSRGGPIFPPAPV